MAKLSICIIAILLTVSLDAGLSGYTGRYKNWDQFHGQQVGFASGQCSVLSGILPDPQSGCCGKHAGFDEDNQDNESNNTDDPNNEDDNKVNVDNNDNGIDYDNHENEDNQIDDDDDDTSTSGDDDIDFGNNEKTDYGDNKEIDDNDTRNDDEDDEDGVFENDEADYGMENVFDGIFDDLKFNDAFNLNKWSQMSRTKRSIENNASDVAPDKFIMAGKKAGLKQFPWLVHIEIKIRDLFKIILIGCGGSLISPRFVLTAAHCVVDVNVASLSDVSIFLAEYDTRTFPMDCVGNKCIKNVQMHSDKIIKHQDFEKNLLENDIALMRLKGSAPYTEYIRPICLPSFNIDYPKNEGMPLQISGWGNTGSQTSLVKLVAEVQLVPQTQCKKHYPKLTTGHICAIGESGQDTCRGDSGGPIMAEHEGNYYVVGIVSGKSSETQCGSSVPTLYTNVFKYTKWIKENMKL